MLRADDTKTGADGGDRTRDSGMARPRVTANTSSAWSRPPESNRDLLLFRQARRPATPRREMQGRWLDAPRRCDSVVTDLAGKLAPAAPMVPSALTATFWPGTRVTNTSVVASATWFRTQGSNLDCAGQS